MQQTPSFSRSQPNLINFAYKCGPKILKSSGITGESNPPLWHKYIEFWNRKARALSPHVPTPRHTRLLHQLLVILFKLVIQAEMLRLIKKWIGKIKTDIIEKRHKNILSWRNCSLRKQPTFRDDTNGFPAKLRLRNGRRNSILMTRHYPDLGSTSDWLKQIWRAARPIRSTT